MAECLTELEGAEMGFLIRFVLCDILQLSSESQVLPVFCVTDNRSVHSTKTLTDKRLKMDICIWREMLHKKEIKGIRWVESKNQLADCLTMDICIWREMLHKKEIKGIRWVESKNQLADCLTKPGSSRSFLLAVLNNASACLNY